MSGLNSSLCRIGVFYDGQYFYNVSNYYKYHHPRNARISIGGLHEFIRNTVASECDIDARLCQIIDTHYFRGRLSASDASSQDLYNDRAFDEILMGENVITHFMPLRQTATGARQERGIDVWLALEAYELAIYKRFDVLVLIASDGDYVPLVRKLNTVGARVMLMYWDFEYIDRNEKKRITRTAHQLLKEASYTIAMHQIIDDEVRGKDDSVCNLFLSTASVLPGEDTGARNETEENVFQSVIHSTLQGYGFISDPENKDRKSVV